LKAKIKLTTTGEEAGASVARGEAEFGVLPVSEILVRPQEERNGARLN